MTRRPMVAGNWKMNMDTTQAVNLSQMISDRYENDMDEADVVLCPPFIDLKSVRNVLEFDHSKIMLGAQNVYQLMPEGTAAATGEISVEMLANVGCDYCIIGHSERRQGFGETDELVNAKALLLAAHGITPIICCGETAQINEEGGTVAHVSAQMETALAGYPPEKAGELVLAYEPIWAIGTGRTPSPEFADGVCRALRGVVENLFGPSAAQDVRVLYGGSVKPGNAALFFEKDDIDGGLIGRAALKADDFIAIVKADR